MVSDATDTVMWQDIDQDPDRVTKTKITNLHRFKMWRLRGEWVDGRGLHSSTFRLNGSTLCKTRWVHVSARVY